jgi:hypothetical protein
MRNRARGRVAASAARPGSWPMTSVRPSAGSSSIAARIDRIRQDWQVDRRRRSLGKVVLEDLNIANIIASARGTMDKPGRNVRQGWPQPKHPRPRLEQLRPQTRPQDGGTGRPGSDRRCCVHLADLRVVRYRRSREPRKPSDLLPHRVRTPGPCRRQRCTERPAALDHSASAQRSRPRLGAARTAQARPTPLGNPRRSRRGRF